MPSTIQSGQGARVYPPFPGIEARIGENPARWLDQELIERGPSHTDVTNQSMVIARIRGIDKIGVVNAWIQVERELDRGPRKPVIGKLEQRRDELIANGERPDGPTMTAAERRARAARLYDEADKDDAVWTDREDGKQTKPVAVGGRR